MRNKPIKLSVQSAFHDDFIDDDDIPCYIFINKYALKLLALDVICK